MMVALASYITWRFWEGLAGQGYDKSFSPRKNFFKFRISPIVSGCVYVSYLIFILQLLDKEVRQLPEQPNKGESWPATWRHSNLGRAGLAVLGVAFCIATCIQLQGVLSKAWHRDYRDDLPNWFIKMVFIIGHCGFAGRAGAFLALAVLFFKDAGGIDDTPHAASMVANALQQLQTNDGLRAVLMIVGILLVAYGLFATLSSYARVFPTPAPTRNRVVPKNMMEEASKHPEQQAGEEGIEQQNGVAGRKSDIELADAAVRQANEHSYVQRSHMKYGGDVRQEHKLKNYGIKPQHISWRVEGPKGAEVDDFVTIDIRDK
eukprot:GHRR01004823.1.p1 GENE.GHRR01004823.1~~GHRR01004823.1.p1  ORF type:complete len:318 (+),score=68.30 GHRR01004823.1:475-1428(+)